MAHAIQQQAPQQPLILFADLAYHPYSALSDDELDERLTVGITTLRHYGAEHILLGCHTASARWSRSDPYVATMLPATLAALHTVARSSRVAVLGSVAFCRQPTYRRAIEALGFAALSFWPSPALIAHAEGILPANESLEVLLEPVLLWKPDVCVLACTHFSFLYPFLSTLDGLGQLLDPTTWLTTTLPLIPRTECTAPPTLLVSSAHPTHLLERAYRLLAQPQLIALDEESSLGLRHLITEAIAITTDRCDPAAVGPQLTP